MWGSMKWSEDVRGYIELILAIGGKKCLFRTKIKHGEGRIGRGRQGKLLAVRFGGHLVLLVDEGHLLALGPRVVTGGVILEPEDEVEVFGGALDVEEIFFQVLEANWRQVATSEDVVQADIEDRGDAARADLAYGRWGIAKAILEQTWSDGETGSRRGD